jgi:NAD(P)-dependent dehydrogenase (short-subunit alcohol dehydrogenase family)
MSGTVLITGATSGLGRHLAERLAAAGWTVYVHGRDAERASSVAAALANGAGPEHPVPFVADLASLHEVRRLAGDVLEQVTRLDVLVNNAGVGFGPPNQDNRQVSWDGHELRLAVNYLAPVALTRQLLPLLRASAPARIVNVGSLGQEPLDLDDVEFERGYRGVDAYRRSKLALAAWTFDLADELRGTGVTVNCLHPATFMATGMVAEAGIDPASSVEDGGRATLRLVTDPELAEVTGEFFDGQRVARAHEQAYDPAFRARLRSATDELVR